MAKLKDILKGDILEKIENNRNCEKYIPSKNVLNSIEKSRLNKSKRFEKCVVNWVRNFADLDLYSGKFADMDSSYLKMDVCRSSNDNYSHIPMKVFRMNDSYDVPFEIKDRRNFKD